MTLHRESAFGSEICDHLAAHGCLPPTLRAPPRQAPGITGKIDVRLNRNILTLW